jgi:hypothetical protein
MQAKRARSPEDISSLSVAVKLWPTPTVCGNYNRKGLSETSGAGLATAVKLWPTPNASDNKDRGNMQNPSVQRRVAIGKQIGLTMAVKETIQPGSLNPDWVELLMGYPIGWTDLNISETPIDTERQESQPEKTDAPND